MSQQQYDNELRGVLFVNDRKTTDKHPDRKRQAQIDGVEYWLSGWINDSETKGKYLKIVFQRKDQADSPTSQPTTAPEKSDDGGDDDSQVPF